MRRKPYRRRGGMLIIEVANTRTVLSSLVRRGSITGGRDGGLSITGGEEVR